MRRSLCVVTMITFVLMATHGWARPLDHNRHELNRSLELRQLADEEDHRSSVSPFGELLTGSYIYDFSIMPTWGTSDWNDIIETGGDGSVTGVNGTIRVRTTDSGADTASIRTVERVEYHPGAQLRAGVRVRGPSTSSLQGGQSYRWGTFDISNGFGWFADTTGIHIFVRKAGSDTVVAQADWNKDTLDGSGGTSNPSGNTLSLSNGNIFEIRYNWYGDGDAFFYALVPDTGGDGREQILMHRETFSGATNVEDPNMPIEVRAENNGTADTTDVFIGGRQASRFGGALESEKRPVVEFVSEVSITTNEVWEPLIACRKKSTFPSGQGRENSARVQFTSVNVSVTGGDALFRVTHSDTANGTFSSPTNWNGESASECNTVSNDLTSAETGQPFEYVDVRAGNQGSSPGETKTGREVIVLGENNIFVLWGRAQTTSDIELNAFMNLNEQW